jgi:preprotein translocase subunit YajC
LSHVIKLTGEAIVPRGLDSFSFRKVATQFAETPRRENPKNRERIFAPAEYQFPMIHAESISFGGQGESRFDRAWRSAFRLGGGLAFAKALDVAHATAAVRQAALVPENIAGAVGGSAAGLYARAHVAIGDHVAGTKDHVLSLAPIRPLNIGGAKYGSNLAFIRWFLNFGAFSDHIDAIRSLSGRRSRRRAPNSASGMVLGARGARRPPKAAACFRKTCSGRHCFRACHGYSPAPNPSRRERANTSGNQDMNFITPAFAQAAAGGASGADVVMQMAPFGIILVIMYFLLIRPQQQKAKAHRDMVSNIRRGDSVVTNGGLIGKVTKTVDDSEIEIEIAPNVRVRQSRAAIAEVRAKGEPVKDNA